VQHGVPILVANEIVASPVIGQTSATFSYFNPDAYLVEFMSDSSGWHRVPMWREGDEWLITREYPSDARDEYMFVVDGEARLDPRNPRLGPGAFGPRSACHMPDYRWPAPIELPVAGKMERRWLAGRMVDVYVPACVQGAAALIVQDGYEYEWFIGMPGLLDAMIRRGEIMPTLAVFVAPRDRDHEYVGNDAYVDWMADRLLPNLYRRYDVHTDAAYHGLVGASAGGLVATYGALRRSDAFHLIAAQSPAYRAIHGIDLPARIEHLQSVDWQSLRLHASVGTFEMVMYGEDFLPAVRNGADDLERRGSAVQYNEVHEGHTWTNWRARLPDALTWLLGPR
jgi:enterochelin esterase-like enzyme